MYIPQAILHTDGGQVLASSAVSGDQNFWVTILMIVMLFSGVGLWTMIKKKPNGGNRQDEDAEPFPAIQATTNQHIKADAALESLVETPDLRVAQAEIILIRYSNGRRRKFSDLKSGLELLELPFLAGVASDTGSRSKLDIEMRKIAFTELARRERLGDIESKVLKVYARNTENTFGKTIQCQAIKELAIRTENEKHEPSVVIVTKKAEPAESPAVTV